jgi:hypothetical protein
MANCGLLLNDGSFVLLNSGGVLLLDDATCGTEAGVAASPVAITGNAAVSFVGASNAVAALSVVGIFADPPCYQSNVFQNNVFQGPHPAIVFVGASDADGAFSATGTWTVSFLGEAQADAALGATGTGTASFVGEDATPPPPPVVVAASGGVAAQGAWRGYGKKNKKKDELDDLIAQLKEQVVPWREAQVGAQIRLLAELNQAEAITLDNTLAQIEAEIANLKEVMADIDDEEAILLLM